LTGNGFRAKGYVGYMPLPGVTSNVIPKTVHRNRISGKGVCRINTLLGVDKEKHGMENFTAPVFDDLALIFVKVFAPAKFYFLERHERTERKRKPEMR
jgi:hypothetical protein